MRNVGKVGAVAAMAVAVFLLAGLGIFRGVRTENAIPAPGAPDPAAFTGPAAGSLDAAIRSLQERLRAEPTDWRGLASLGLAYVQQARVTADPSYYPKAEGALQQSLDLNVEDNDQAAVGMSALAAARHDFAVALDWGERAKAINPYSAAVYGVIGDAQLELGRYGAAFTTFQQMVDLRPDLSSLSRVSYARELMGDVPGAIEAMEQAKRYASDPADRAWASYQLGELSFNRGDLSSAAAAYREGTRLDPAYVPNFAGLAKVGWARGDLDGAIRGYAGVVARYPSPEYVIALGDLYRAAGHGALAAEQDGLLDAEESLLEASGVNVDLEQALFDAGHGDPRGGLAAARAEWDRRHSVQVADALAWALHESGRDEEAVRYANLAMRLGTRSALFAFHAGMIQRSLGHLDSARTLLAEAAEINPYFSIQYAPALERALAGLGGGS
ncbi:MAG TPA: tetratricopeptide repeat protein [Actinomycetota bacterium]|jgi:tetratricopeptide (TPR) repeat protein|nr:tetratricopeptide repeat protein [Actinomycetota bacterium]